MIVLVQYERQHTNSSYTYFSVADPKSSSSLDFILKFQYLKSCSDYIYLMAFLCLVKPPSPPWLKLVRRCTSGDSIVDKGVVHRYVLASDDLDGLLSSHAYQKYTVDSKGTYVSRQYKEDIDTVSEMVSEMV
jgi:hypothetical protein